MLAGTQDTELDTGPRRNGPRAERFCVATRTVKPVEELIRFVVSPDGVVPDLKCKLPGRGIWVTATKAAVSDAIAHKAFARGFKRDVRVPPDLADLTERLMTRAVLDALAIAGKSGRVVAGFTKVEAALGRDRVAALLHATDAGHDGVAKLKGPLLLRPDADRIGVVREFTSAQLDLALSRSNVVHAALLAGPASDTFLGRFERLERFRTGKSGESGNESGNGRAPN